LVINSSLHYDARSENHSIVYTVSTGAGVAQSV
jgi:hypothetical protein